MPEKILTTPSVPEEETEDNASPSEKEAEIDLEKNNNTTKE